MLRLFTRIVAPKVNPNLFSGVSKFQEVFTNLNIQVRYQFGLSYLFQKEYFRGHHRHSHQTPTSSKKKRIMANPRNYRMTNSNSLLKRIKIVGSPRNRRFKFKAAGARHLNRNSSRANLKRKRTVRYIQPCDIRRIKRMIPGWKRQKLKLLH